MPSISRKGQTMPASPIRKLVPFSEAAKKRGIHVYHLNIGQPDIETPENVMNKIRNIDLKVIEYSHSAGILSYRKKLAEYYLRNGITVTPDQMIVTAGGSEAILFAMNTCLDPGDEIIIPEPFYANYNGFSVSSGVVVKPIDSFIESGFALPPMQAFEDAITPKTKES
jgi:aspartate aminotransferase